jgi:molecular chaperone DnaK (HSP70)
VTVRLGIDFGTTHTVVAAVDRGNYPIVSFHDAQGGAPQWYPSVAALHGGKWRYGLDAIQQGENDDKPLLRSFKRRLAGCSPDFQLEFEGVQIAVIDLLTGYLTALKADLLHHSNLNASADDVLEAMISVPANANNNQRFITAESFRRAGFKVLGMVNEPTAAGVEYAHRFGVKGEKSRKHYLLVFDLGGGTFDVSIIGIGPHLYTTVATAGVTQLGGDDFDRQLLDLALEKAQLDKPVTAAEKARLLQECREKKESLHPNTRKISIDLERAIPGAGDVSIPVAEYYQRCEPLVDRTIDLVNDALETAAETHGLELADIASLYIVGGGSHFPLVNRRLRETFSRLVRRSAYPHGAAAVGLAIAADSVGELKLNERFTRDVGVWREAAAGTEIVLDRLLTKGMQLPSQQEKPLVVKRSYRPTHNIGFFRYVECGHINERGEPSDDITAVADIRFPFDHHLQGKPDLDAVVIKSMESSDSGVIEETYTCSADGMVQLTIRDTTSGYEQDYLLIAGDAESAPQDDRH